MQIQKVCQNCGTAFSVIPSRAKTAKTCSRACKYATHPKTKSGRCECAQCGKAFMAPVSRIKRGNGRYCSMECFRFSQREGSLRDARSAQLKGDKNPMWRGGIASHSDGYIYERCPDHPLSSNSYVFQHRLVVERRMLEEVPDHPFIADGYLPVKIHVHHRDEDRSNNHPDNLMAMTESAHRRWHNSGTLPDPWECWPNVHPAA